MTQQADAHYVEQYRNRTTHIYQAEGFLLRGTVQAAERIEGTKAYWPKHGKGSARKKIRGQPAIPMNPDKSKVSTDLVTWEAFDEVYTYDLSRQNVAEKENTARAGAMALGRATDYEILQVANAGAALAGNNFIDLSAIDLNPRDLLDASSRLQKVGVPWRKGDLFCMLPPLQFNQMMSYKVFSSGDYVGPDLPFVNMTMVRTWNNVNWMLMPEQAEYTVTNAVNTYDVFLWHRSALGWHNNEELRMIWDWDNRAGCWTVRMESEGAAIVVQSEGICRLRLKDTGVIPVATT
jgi:hypothetical protein